AQSWNRREFTDVQRSQPLGQTNFVAGLEGPVGEIVRETFPDEVMFLQSAKSVLKNRTIGAGAQSFQQLAQVSGLLTFDTKQMGDSIEEKRRFRPTLQFSRRQLCSCHQKSP